MRLLVWLMLSLFLPLSHAQAGLELTKSIQLSEQTPQKIIQMLYWCETDAAVSQNSPQSLISLCDFKLVPALSLPRGFTSKTQLLKFVLHNPSNAPTMGWVEVGNPRMSRIKLFFHDERGWQHHQTGLLVPNHERPIISQRLLLPVELEANQTQVYYLAVNTETKLDLSLTLWSLKDYLYDQGRRQIIQSLGIGGLLLAAFFTLMIFHKTRDSALLLLTASFVSQILLDASYTGMLSAYFWPANVPYFNGLHGFFIGGTIIFLVLFMRGFLNTSQRYPLEDRILKVLLVLLILTTAAFTWQYALPIRIIAALVSIIMLVSIWVFFRAWRDGSGPAGYLLISYLLLLFLIVYRASSAFGWVDVIPLQTLGFSWYFLLITPTTLLALLKHAENLQEKLIRTQSEKEAHKLFLASMSHELRSPLNSILGQSNWLQSAPEHAVKPGLEIIENSGHRLLSMIDEILDYSRTQTGMLKIYPEPTDLAEFFSELEHHIRLLDQKNNNQIKLQIDPALPQMVFLDERRLRQVIDNLLSNANRYCQNGVIRLKVKSKMADKTSLVLAVSVSDSGLGISPEEQSSILLPFSRGGMAESQEKDGMGLGLAITAELLNLMGSRIKIESQLGKGSTFSFQLLLQLVQPSSVPQLDTQQISFPDRHSLMTLKHLADQGAITDIQAWLQTMQKEVPQHQAFYAQVDNALNKLDFNQIHSLCS